MDLYGQPVQNVYHTFLHLSDSINGSGSLVYDGRGNPSIIKISTNACSLSGDITLNSLNFSLSNNTTGQDILSSKTVLSVNHATSSVNLHSINKLLPKRQHMYVLSSVELPSFNADVFTYKTVLDGSSSLFNTFNMPNLGDEVITVQKFYYQGVLREILYDMYIYRDSWEYIITV